MGCMAIGPFNGLLSSLYCWPIFAKRDISLQIQPVITENRIDIRYTDDYMIYYYYYTIHPHTWQNLIGSQENSFTQMRFSQVVNHKNRKRRLMVASEVDIQSQDF